MVDPGLSNTLGVFRFQVSGKKESVVVEEKELLSAKGCT